MANYCANVVVFSGELAGLLRLQTLFAQAEYGTAFRPAMLPEDDESSYFFDASMQGNKLYYETRWVPNLQSVLQLAEHLGLEYVHQYDECSNMVYGEAWRKNGEFEHVWLDFNDIAGHDFESWEDLLQEKKRRLAETPAMFRTSSSITAEELEETYGPLLTGDLFIKLALHKNFMKAKNLFDSLDEETINLMENYLDSEMELITPQDNRDEVIALLFLRDCLNKWQPAQKPRLHR